MEIQCACGCGGTTTRWHRYRAERRKWYRCDTMIVAKWLARTGIDGTGRLADLGLPHARGRSARLHSPALTNPKMAQSGGGALQI